MTEPMWIYHPTIGLYYNWHPRWRRWVWNTTDKRNSFQLRPVDPFQPDSNITCDPFAQSILAWGASKETTPGTIQQHYETTGGWEVWVQSELHVAFANNPSRHPEDSTWRESHLYANAPGDSADFLVHFQPPSPYEKPVSAFIELKCERFGDRDCVNKWANQVRHDIEKINHAVVKKDHYNPTGPYHGYAIALTKTPVGDDYMRGLGMSMEPSFGGRDAGFNLWWYHRVCH
ncbi:hypothetical protein NHQ30_008131 [Ciborinia camelliae]|nr:hypothetical protein NHQ30_008131 [Ciborinia camelliae]